MRISTLGFQTDASARCNRWRRRSPDPDGAVHRHRAAECRGQSGRHGAGHPAECADLGLEQYQTNGTALNSNLQIEEQSLSDATKIMQSARDLALEANNASLTAAQRQDIATQLQQLLQQPMSAPPTAPTQRQLPVRGDASTTQPFSQSGGTVAYNGSAPSARCRSAPISASPAATPAPASS